MEAAYRYGGEWLNELMVYVKDNLDFLRTFLRKLMPEVILIEPEGTYLVWLDFRAWKLSAEQLKDKMINIGKIALDEGYIFGEEGAGFERINIACPRSILEDGVKRIADAVKSL